MIYFKLHDILTKQTASAQYIVLFLLTSRKEFLYITPHLVGEPKLNFLRQIRNQFCKARISKNAKNELKF